MRRIPMILLLAALAAPAWSFTLVDNSTGPSIAVCPCCVSVLSPWPVQYLPAGGAQAISHRATMLADYPGMNVAIGGPAPGTLTVDSYYAWCKGLMCGAHLSGPPWPIWWYF